MDVVGGFPLADGSCAKALTGIDDHCVGFDAQAASASLHHPGVTSRRPTAICSRTGAVLATARSAVLQALWRFRANQFARSSKRRAGTQKPRLAARTAATIS
jgi:hypothetical protein